MVPVAIVCLAVGTLISAQLFSSTGNELLASGEAAETDVQLNRLPIEGETSPLPEVTLKGVAELPAKDQTLAAGPENPFDFTPEEDRTDSEIGFEEAAPIANPSPISRVAGGAPIRTAAAIRALAEEARIDAATKPQPLGRAHSFGTKSVNLTLDWVTPESILVGQEGDFELVLRNRGRVAVDQITVRQVLPAGFRLVKATPAAVEAGDQPYWEIAKIEPQEEARISLRLIPDKVGTANSYARVNFSIPASSRFKVVEPKLKLIAEASDTVLIGNQVVYTLTVQNPGTGKATNVSIEAKFEKGLDRVEKASIYRLGVINPGESRSIQVHAKAADLGKYASEFIATADHGLRDEATKEVTALGARLDLVISGPKFRYVTRPAAYTVRIKNTGTAAAQNVGLRCAIPKAFAYLEAGHGGRFDSTSKTVNWFVGTLEVGKEFVGTFKLRAQEPGEYPIFAQAVAERGLKARAQQSTKVDGIAAILLEVVDVADPVEVGAETVYEILVTNQGTDFAKSVNIKATVPEGMKIISADGPTGNKIDGRTIRFGELSKLAPRADAIYRLKVRASKAGDARVEVQVTTDSLKTPVTELESTQVYRD
jgi:uncharacterized repeat protein (TIGR01451 family)